LVRAGIKNGFSGNRLKNSLNIGGKDWNLKFMMSVHPSDVFRVFFCFVKLLVVLLIDFQQCDAK